MVKEFFPRGEVRVQGNMGGSIYCEWENDSDTMAIGQMVDIARRQGVYYVELVIPYLPYSRQDRATEETSSFSLYVFSKMLNSFGINRIITYDVHSEVSTKLINNLISIPNNHYIKGCLEHIDNPIVIAPDKGASLKIEKTLLGTGVEFVQAEKVRDPKSGKILGITIDDTKLVDRNVLIVDDICSAGGTFLGIKNLISCKSISLAVTHFDNVSGVTKMVENFDKVFSWKRYGLGEINVNYIRVD